MSFTKITWVLKSGRILRSYVQLLLARICLKIFHKEIAINIVFPTKHCSYTHAHG